MTKSSRRILQSGHQNFLSFAISQLTYLLPIKLYDARHIVYVQQPVRSLGVVKDAYSVLDVRLRKMKYTHLA